MELLPYIYLASVVGALLFLGCGYFLAVAKKRHEQRPAAQASQEQASSALLEGHAAELGTLRQKLLESEQARKDAEQRATRATTEIGTLQEQLKDRPAAPGPELEQHRKALESERDRRKEAEHRLAEIQRDQQQSTRRVKEAEEALLQVRAQAKQAAQQAEEQAVQQAIVEDELNKKKDQLQALEQQLKKAPSPKETGSSELATQRAALEKALNEKNARVQSLEQQLRRAQEQAKNAAQPAPAFEAQRAALEKTLNERNARIQALEQQLKKPSPPAKKEESSAAIERELREKNVRLQTLEQQLKKVQTELEVARTKSAITSKSADPQQAMDQLKEKMSRAQPPLPDQWSLGQIKEAEALKQRVQELEEKLSEATTQAKESEAKWRDQQMKLTALDAALSKEKQRHGEVAATAQQQKQQLAALEEKRGALLEELEGLRRSGAPSPDGTSYPAREWKDVADKLGALEEKAVQQLTSGVSYFSREMEELRHELAEKTRELVTLRNAAQRAEELERQLTLQASEPQSLEVLPEGLTASSSLQDLLHLLAEEKDLRRAVIADAQGFLLAGGRDSRDSEALAAATARLNELDHTLRTLIPLGRIRRFLLTDERNSTLCVVKAGDKSESELALSVVLASGKSWDSENLVEIISLLETLSREAENQRYGHGPS